MSDIPDPDRRARSFGAVAAAYAAHRPGYPDAAIDWALDPLAGRAAPQLLDLGAGTGKLTASLVARPGTTVVAVEPDAEMLARLRIEVPGATVLEGSAETIPLPNASVDAVLCGQSFHWFDEARAMPEIARVLRPGGVLAALWNADDSDVDWVAGYHEVASRDLRCPGCRAAGTARSCPHTRPSAPASAPRSVTGCGSPSTG
ncbi:class I SAM-dependent methyltransferase [Pseudonocardia acidicola]|uniref:class I SAM-dependent methyltransferase n=1 Tax=Pseudonocardia acidicola TaxID=2724939 RepID=UPI001EF0EBD0|nr:class I SAM-dependent methyltransferase [Pseudonocardia acidicola]